MTDAAQWDNFLRQAIYEQDTEMIRAALAEGANAGAVLEHALYQGDLDLMGEALAAGADPNANLEDGTTPLSVAASSGRVPVVKLLIKSGATVASECSEENLHEMISLHEAIEKEQTGILKLLLETECGPGLDWFDYVSRTPLMVAISKEDIDSVHALLVAGADVNAHEEAKIGDTALMVAANEGLYDMAKLLLSAGADPTIRCWMGTTPISVARERKRPEGRALAALLEAAAKTPRRYDTIVVRNEVYERKDGE